MIALKQKTTCAKNKIFAFVFLSLISIIFWTLYSLEPSLLSVYIASNTNTVFLGLNIPATSFFAFDGIFIIFFGLILSRVWVFLSQKKRNPSLPSKFAGSLIIIGLGFCLLAIGARYMGNALMPSSYIVFIYAIFAIAELLVSPLGISMVGSLAPEGQEGLMMGFWQLCLGIGGVISGYVAIIPHLAIHPKSLAVSNVAYSNVFFIVGGSSVIAGCLILPLIKKLKYLMKEPDLET